MDTIVLADHQLWVDTGYCLEDQPVMIDYKEE